MEFTWGGAFHGDPCTGNAHCATLVRRGYGFPTVACPFLDPGGHPVNQAGRFVVDYMRPFDSDGCVACENLFAAGALLADLARIMHEPPAATADMAVLPGVLGSRTLRCTEKVRLRSEPLWLPGGTTISTISRRRLVHNAG